MDSTALIAMSGGVDSSVAALLTLKQHSNCAGATLELTNSNETSDAKSICEKLGIPHYSLNCRKAFNERVVASFISDYEHGLTPNPCIECNRLIKFGLLYDKASAMGYQTLITGHYARITHTNGHFYLQKALDSNKDQSYVLYIIRRELLQYIEFPLGTLTKTEVRELAAQNGFANSNKQDSQDICFIPDGDYVSFIERYTNHTYSAGDFVDINGNILGHHSGAIHYTIGQRRGLGVSYSEPLYVKSKNGSTVTLCVDRELYSDRLVATNVNMLVPDNITALFKCHAKIRYHHKEQPCTVEFTSPDTISVIFDTPQRAITPGQAVVLYDGDTVIGGGTITS